MLIALTMAISSFHFSTLEEYYTGGLFLGPGNGISDGSVGIVGIFIVLGMFGNEWTQGIVFGETRLVDVIIFGVTLANLVIIILCVRGIFVHQYKEINYDAVTNTGDITGEPLVVKDFVLQVVGYALPMSLLAGILFVGEDGKRLIDSPIDKESGHNNMFDVMLLQCFLMQHLTCSVQVNHVSKYKYSPWRNRLNLFLMVFTVIVYVRKAAAPSFCPCSSVQFMLLVTIIAQWHYILHVVHEMSNALGIRILCVQDMSNKYAEDKIYSDSIDQSQKKDSSSPDYEMPEL